MNTYQLHPRWIIFLKCGQHRPGQRRVVKCVEFVGYERAVDCVSVSTKHVEAGSGYMIHCAVAVNSCKINMKFVTEKAVIETQIAQN